MKIFKGIEGAPGIAAGRVLYFEKNQGGRERRDFGEAVKEAAKRVRTLKNKAMNDLGEDRAKIFSAYEMLLEDTMLTAPMQAEIENGAEPEAAVDKVTGEMARVLESKKSEYMRQRADDIRYVGELIKEALCGANTEFEFPAGDEKFVLAANELTPVDTMLFDANRLAGLATEKGGITSHTVILAKSMGIPAVVGIKNLSEISAYSGKAYIDGYNGTLATSVSGADEERYEELLEKERLFIKQLEEIKKTDAQTKDKKRISVLANIGKPSDLKDAQDERFDGVGLFRSEFLYSASDKKPTVIEQTEAYKKAIDFVSPNSVTIRTIDVGGDKKIGYLNMKAEENPFLGNRGIRLCLKNTEIFSEQLEAILIAGAGKSVKVMLPMISSINEIKQTKEIISEIQKSLEERNISYCRELSIGIMIETPASAVMADAFAKHCDFFSIGTNDLVQYLMAADRGNAEVENVYNPYHPAVLRTINSVIKAGKNAGIEVSVCGDLAANTAFTKLLLGMGLEKFSVPIPAIGRIKHTISQISLNEAKELAEKVLALENEDEISELLRKG